MPRTATGEPPSIAARWHEAQTRRNLIFNVAGLVLPLFAAFIALPLLIHNLGLQRFGIFMLLLAVLTYVSVFDLGMGSAVTYRLSALIGQPNHEEDVLRLVHTAMAAVLVIGGIMCLACFIAAGWAPVFMTDSTRAAMNETVWSLRILALAIPAMFAGSLMAGVLSAHGKFVQLNKVRIPAGVLTYLAPALGSLLTPDLVLASSLLLTVRLAIAIAHGYQCRRLLPALLHPRLLPLSKPVLQSLVQFGGWLTLSNIVGPFMIYMDRFYLGAIRSAEEVARYVTPYELATKLSVLPAAVLPVLFPILVAGWIRPSEASGQLPVKTAAWMGLGCALPAALLAALAPEIMRIWLGGRLAADSAVVLQILSGAVLVNSVAQVFFIFVQSTGRTDLIARIHLAELLGYGALLWMLTDRSGIVGVALAWAIRVAVDAALFCQAAGSRLSGPQRRMSWIVLGAALAFGSALASLGWVESLALRMLAVFPPIGLVWALRREVVRLWSGPASGAVPSPAQDSAVKTNERGHEGAA